MYVTTIVTKTRTKTPEAQIATTIKDKYKEKLTMPTKHEYDKALFRISVISTMLVRDHRPNIKDLALEFNVTVKTIQNDLYKRLHMYDIAKDEFGRLILKNKHISEIEFFKELPHLI